MTKYKNLSDLGKIDQAFTKFIKTFSPTVIFIASMSELEKSSALIDYVFVYSQHGARIVSLSPLPEDRFLAPKKEIFCKSMNKKQQSMFLYSAEIESFVFLKNFLDPMKNNAVPYVMNIAFVAFLAVLAMMIVKEFHTVHAMILFVLSSLLMISINWFLMLLRKVNKQLDDELKEASQKLKLDEVQPATLQTNF